MERKTHPLYNMNASDTPLPRDPREIEAVLHTAARFYEIHPYLLTRYGADGAAFSRSGGGYLVTLSTHPRSYVIYQIEWFGVMHASRGMPRWLLEGYLDLLHEDLLRAVPTRAVKYRKLQVAAQCLREARQAWISQAEFDALAASFVASDDMGWTGAGALVAAAVCDECCGLTRAVPSLMGWLGDGEQFSPAWREAVFDMLERTRAVVRQKRPG